MFTSLEDNADLGCDISLINRNTKKKETVEQIASRIIVKKARYYFRILMRAYEFRVYFRRTFHIPS